MSLDFAMDRQTTRLVAPADVRAVLVELLNKYCPAGKIDAHAPAAVPAALVSEALKALGAELLVEVLDVEAVYPVCKAWEGDVEIDLDDHLDAIRDAVEDGLSEPTDDLDIASPGYTEVTVTADVSAKVRRTVEVERYTGTDLGEAVAEQADLPDDWEADGDPEIGTVTRRCFR